MDRAMELIRDARTVAVVGVSSNPKRPSNEVATYLQNQGFRVYMVNPRETEVLGQPAYASVSDLPEEVDIVDIFRRSEDVPPIVNDAIAAGAKTIWLQLDISNEEAEACAREAGLDVIVDRCTKIEHLKL
tara:strand:- start:1706 stop:2095 length:390 start_codon:yes stop_codon:yes gene_type:complete